MKSCLDHTLGIPLLGGRGGQGIRQETQALVKREDELAPDLVIGDNVSGEHRNVDSFVDLLQENDGEPKLEGHAQLGVVALDGSGPVVVVEQPALNVAVVIWTGGGADDAEGGGQVTRVPDSLACVDDAACLAIGEEERR